MEAIESRTVIRRNLVKKHTFTYQYQPGCQMVHPLTRKERRMSGRAAAKTEWNETHERKIPVIVIPNSKQPDAQFGRKAMRFVKKFGREAFLASLKLKRPFSWGKPVATA